MNRDIRQWLLNVARLSFKELRSLLGDAPLVALILFAFTISVYTTAKGVKAEVSHASVGWIDADQSALSMRLRDAIRPPYFQPPRDISAQQAGPALDRGDVIFVIDVPPHFEADVLAGRAPAIQVTVDATAMTQAGLGVAYRAKPIVAAQADAKVDHADLTALLYFQGYRFEEFAQ